MQAWDKEKGETEASYTLTKYRGSGLGDNRYWGAGFNQRVGDFTDDVQGLSCYPIEPNHLTCWPEE